MRFVGWFAYRVARVITWLLATFLWRIEIEGKANVPKTGPFLLCPNHRSNADGPLTCILTRRQMKYLAKSEMFDIENLGKLYASMGAIPVHRGEPDRASLKACMEVMKAGKGLVLFPEGTRQTGPEITDIHEGAAYVALRGNAPIIPVAFGNSAGAHKKGKLYLSPVKVKCIIGDPIILKRESEARVTRAEIEAGTEVLRAKLQELFDRSEGRRVS